MTGGLYIAIFVNDWQNGILVAFFAVALAVIESVYFYKRRVMFGASGRWRRLAILPAFLLFVQRARLSTPSVD